MKKHVSLIERNGCWFIVTDCNPCSYCNAAVATPRRDGMWIYCDDRSAVMFSKSGAFHPKNVRTAANHKSGEDAQHDHR